eukprot:10041151-Alexandrium_andersonii.AAC.1
MPLSALENVRSERVSLLRSLRRPRWVRLNPNELIQTTRGQLLLRQQGDAYARRVDRMRPPPPPPPHPTAGS